MRGGNGWKARIVEQIANYERKSGRSSKRVEKPMAVLGSTTSYGIEASDVDVNV
jgi:hypothetical protein